MRKYRRMREQANPKAESRQGMALEAQLPMEELVSRAREDLETFATEIGLTIIPRGMEAEMQMKVGRWAQQPVHRHGHQPGYVIIGGQSDLFGDTGIQFRRQATLHPARVWPG